MNDPVLALAERLADVRARIAQACQHARRSPDSVTLIAVSKTHPPDVILAAAAQGQIHFGENRAEEAAHKIPVVRQQSGPTAARLVWHMIGHVQSRKAREVAAIFDTIHSLDGFKLAERLSRFAAEAGRRPLPVLLEMNVSGEASKEGFAAAGWRESRTLRESLWEDIRRMIELPGLRIDGLMTMAPIADDPEQVRPVFTALRELRDALAAEFPAADWRNLSMGMTDDYPVAIEEGATMVRIGRAIFGSREAGQ